MARKKSSNKSPASGPLRLLYEKDKKAAAFFRRHPEMAGHDVEESVSSQDGHESTFYEREASRTSEASLKIQEALPHFPDPNVVTILEWYYAGETMKELSERLKRGAHATRLQIQRWRATVLLWALARPWEARKLSPADICSAKKSLVYGKERREVYCVNETWIDGEWNVMPSDVQAVLDNLDWEFLDLRLRERSEA